MSAKSKRKRLLTRAGDLLMTAITAPVLVPIAAAVAAAVKLDSKGPVIFKQERVGLDGETFTIYKFRTMLHDEEREKGSKYMVKDSDPNVTKVGEFLRKSHLDELAQLFNVVKGDMSWVGPRPHPTLHAEYFQTIHPEYQRRHTVKPGMTGLEQVTTKKRTLESGDEQKDVRARIDLDLEYIDNNSAMMDVTIICKTAGKVVSDSLNKEADKKLDRVAEKVKKAEETKPKNKSRDEPQPSQVKQNFSFDEWVKKEADQKGNDPDIPKR